MPEPASERAPDAGPPAWLPAWARVGLILAAAVLLHWPSLSTPFFADDHLFLDQLGGRTLGEALARPDPLGNYVRPVSRQLYFWLLARATHESAPAFHLANLLLFLVALALLFQLVRMLAGERAGLVAAAFLALHYAADLPLKWASGCQELLAVAGALAALRLHLGGRRWLAGLAMLMAALSKETVLLTPAIAVVAGRRPGEAWRSPLCRAWPMAAALAIWLLLWLALPHAPVLEAGRAGLHPAAPLAALVHLVQVSLGLEWRPGELGRLPASMPPWIAIALALGAATLHRSGRKAPASDEPSGPAGLPAPRLRPGAIRLGLLWALLAALPIAIVVEDWSAYYYLFALCGVALALGAWLARLPSLAAPVALILLACGSASARGLAGFAPGANRWATQSHLNRHYIDRAIPHLSRYLADLRRLHPSFPPGSTLFFTGLTSNLAFQAWDGPLVRRAYRDTSLRAYYLSGFTVERARRGAFFVFTGAGDSLAEIPAGPGRLADLALSLVVADQVRAAREVLGFERDRSPQAPPDRLLPWVQWALNDRPGALESLRMLGSAADAGPAPEIQRALAATAAGDTLAATALMEGAVRDHALDPGAHALLADLRLTRDPDDPLGIQEAYAARVLAPESPLAWRRWGMVQARQRQYLEARASLRRYLALAGDGVDDPEARRWIMRLGERVAGDSPR